MKKFINIIGLLILFVGFANNIPAIRVWGDLEDVSPNEKWILYKAPHKSKRDDFNEGTLYILNIEKNEIATIADDITLEDPNSLFLSDSIVARPAHGKIVCYDIYQKAIVNDLVTFDPELEFLKFSISRSKMQLALLLKDNRAGQVFLQVIDLVDHKKYEISHQLPCLGQCGDAVSSPIWWYNNHVIYAVHNQLYDYQLGSVSSLLISDNLYDYALNQDEILFIEWDKIATYKFKKFNFAQLEVEDFVLKEDLDLRHVKFISLDTFVIDHMSQAMLNLEHQKFYIVQKDGLLKPQENLFVYQSSQLTIRKELTTSISIYDKVTRVVDRQGLVIESAIH
ncbi:MAG: hypothetical protein BGO68_04150 [Candidatus Amoebophilus sp. 36-38]|nr:MAG: hypothetical protein BGO68_04150 [Candidatus Amoebophilus sp. 36-38]